MEYLRSLPFSSLAGGVEYRAATIPNKTAIFYPDPDTNSTEYTSLTYKQYNNVLNHLAGTISKYLPNHSSNESTTCGILAVGGIEYLLCQYALLKLNNVIMFPISARNSPAAIEHLLRETKTSLLMTTSQYLPIIETIQQEKEFQSLIVLLLDGDEFKIEQFLNKKDIEYTGTSNLIVERKKDDAEVNKIIMILHSTGSTAHPKPIYLTNRYFLIRASTAVSINENAWKEDDVILVWGPAFHLLGFNCSTRALLSASTLALPLCVTFPPKPDELLRNIQVNNGLTVLITVPSLLEQLIRELLLEKNQHIGLKPLQKLRFIMYGGAGCPDELCKMLVDSGVILLSVYGATETGIVLEKNFDPYDKRWKFMEIPAPRKPYVRIEIPRDTQNPNERYLVHLPNDPFLAENISNSPDGCYTVGDILLEDPPNSGQYQILGRQDDTLVHLNGEKTNPLPMENLIRSSPLVKQVAIIGHNQFCTAALIELNIEQVSNSNSNEIEEKIWQIVEQANKSAPSHSRIIRQLVQILPSDQTLPLTDKGNLMRRKVNQQFSTLISHIYDQFLNQQQQNKEKEQTIWTKEKLENYLKEKLKSILHLEDLTIENNFSKSIFDFGFNSLQILELTNLISKDICQIPMNFLYEYSSIEQITDQLIIYLQSSTEQQQNQSDQYQLTEQILDKYINRMKTDQISIKKRENSPKERIFLVTGSNGSLGCFIIRDLLQQSSSIVKRIYCLLRGTNPKERLFDSFKQRELDISILTDGIKQQRLIILESPMNLTEENFGQNESIYEELKTNVTDLIHSAWKMNFNQTIKDFEYDSIFSLYNLLKFSSYNKIQFHFISSVASAGSGVLTNVKEEPLPRNAHVALAQGYGLSKYASEHLCWTAYHLWNVPVNIYRVGQISGDTTNGIWNSTEMAPMMIYAAGGRLNIMPDKGGDINWIPVDICSAAMVDLALKSSFDVSLSTNERVYHLINPNSLKYEDYLNCLREAGLNFDIVPPKEFLNIILNSNDPTNPLIKLSPFLQQIYNNKETLKLSKYETIQTVEKCQLLKNCPKIDSNLIKLYLNYWKKCQLF